MLMSDSIPPRGAKVTVEDPVTSLATDYGRSKAAGETYVRRLQAQDAPVVTFYPSGIYAIRFVNNYISQGDSVLSFQGNHGNRIVSDVSYNIFTYLPKYSDFRIFEIARH